MKVILCGLSASGKNYVMETILKNNKNFKRLVTCTTRPKREGEQDGVDYHFYSKEDFLKGIENGEFFEYRTYDTLLEGKPDTWYYGTRKKGFEEDNIVAILDIPGAVKVKKECPLIKIYIVCADELLIRERAKQRKGYDETEFNRRILDDKKTYDKLDYRLINGIILNNSEEEMKEQLCQLQLI